MRKILNNMLVIVMTASLAVVGRPALAQQTVRVGVVAEFSGPFAEYGTQIVNGMKTYLKLHGETFGRQEDRDHQAGHDRGCAGDRQAARAGIGHA